MPSSAGVRVLVIDVVDGDTIDIQYQNGSRDTVRLLGIDAPETNSENTPGEYEGVPNNRAGADCLEAEGEDSSAHLKQLLSNERITLRFDEESDRRGYYGRLLAYVVYQNTTINYQLVAQGYARVYDSQFTQRDRFYDAESSAQAADRGLWRCQNIATPTPEPSGDGGTLEVVGIHPDAAGNDHENENGEYVVLKNPGSASVDLTGWRVADEAGHVYYFPSGFTLSSGAKVTLYTGSGADTASSLYWGSDSAIWNNGGDTIYIYDAAGDLVGAWKYE